MLWKHREGFLSDILVKFESYIGVNHGKKSEVWRRALQVKYAKVLKKKDTSCILKTENKKTHTPKSQYD